MDPRDVIYYTEHRLEMYRRERANDRLVQLAKQSQVRGARIFRIFPPRKREPEPTTD